MNVNQIKDRALRLLDDDTEAPVFFSSAELDDTILEALEIVSEEVEEIRKTVFFNLVPGTFLYRLPAIASDIMYPYRLTNRRNEEKITYSSMRELDNISRDREDITADRPFSWYMVSWDTIGLYPTPTVASDVIRLDYISTPAIPWKSLGEVEFEESVHQAVYLYLCYDMLMKQWDVEQALEYYNNFILLWRDSSARHVAHKWMAQRRAGALDDSSSRNY